MQLKVFNTLICASQIFLDPIQKCALSKSLQLEALLYLPFWWHLVRSKTWTLRYGSYLLPNTTHNIEVWHTWIFMLSYFMKHYKSSPSGLNSTIRDVCSPNLWVWSILDGSDPKKFKNKMAIFILFKNVTTFYTNIFWYVQPLRSFFCRKTLRRKHSLD